ncbi:MAG: alpha/beta fold hydrolase [Myxococcota bacterium]
MASPTNLLNPWTAYSALRDQLGSVRRVYLARPATPEVAHLQGRSDVVALIHGFFQTPNIWDVMEDRLRHDGFGVVTFHLKGLLGRFNTRRVDACARTVGMALHDLREAHPELRIHLVGHSKGGIIARRLVQHQGGDEYATSVTTLGTPHHGTPLAAVGMAILGMSGTLRSSANDLLPGSSVVEALSRDTFPAHIPLTSIYSTSDLVTPTWSATLRPRPGEHHLENVQVKHVGHSELVWDAGVYRVVRERLEQAAALAQERLAGTDEEPRACPIDDVLRSSGLPVGTRQLAAK